ncbi:Fatty acid synthase beta subunit pkiC [Dirofilaria immitis]
MLPDITRAQLCSKSGAVLTKNAPKISIDKYYSFAMKQFLFSSLKTSEARSLAGKFITNGIPFDMEMIQDAVIWIPCDMSDYFHTCMLGLWKTCDGVATYHVRTFQYFGSVAEIDAVFDCCTKKEPQDQADTLFLFYNSLLVINTCKQYLRLDRHHINIIARSIDANKMPFLLVTEFIFASMLKILFLLFYSLHSITWPDTYLKRP